MEELIQILSECCPAVDFENETALVDDELIDHAELENIASELMDAYEIEITAEDLVAENFNSAEAIMDLIDRRRED